MGCYDCNRLGDVLPIVNRQINDQFSKLIIFVNSLRQKTHRTVDFPQHLHKRRFSFIVTQLFKLHCRACTSVQHCEMVGAAPSLSVAADG